MAARQDIAFCPAFERVLAEHFHDASVGRELAAIGVLGPVAGEPRLLAGS